MQDMLVYHPQEPSESKYYSEQPSNYNIPYETVDLRTTDSVRLHTYLLKQHANFFNTAPTIIFFHGNAGN
jgi:abhydrolase domain-containing protein 13